MGYNPELTKQILGEVGPLRFNPRVVKICQQCGKQDIVRYKGGKKPTTKYYCRSCVVNRPEVKEKLSQSTSRQWEDNDFRKTVTANSKAIWNNPDLRQRMSKMHHDPTIRQQTIQRNQSQEYDSARIAANMRALWLDNDYRIGILRYIHESKRTTAEVIAQLHSINGDRFDYSITEYIDSHTKFKVRCRQCGNDQYTHIHNHIRNGYCHYCQVSKGQRQIVDFIKGINDSDILINDRTMITPHELDIYLPNHKLAIEYHGLFRHSYDHIPTKVERYRHQQKAIICRENHIRLLQIFSSEWDHKKEIVMSIIRHNLGISSKSIAARKCILTTAVPCSFFEQYHLQGHRGASVNLGLIYEGELVSAMSFARHPKYEWEIMRYATKLDMAIVGGASRLFAYFKRLHKPRSVTTYSDMRYSTGNIYRVLGFAEQQVTKPNYFYTDKLRLFSRQLYQKYKLYKRLQTFDPIKTEPENCFDNGLRIVYDAGHIKWLLSSPA